MFGFLLAMMFSLGRAVVDGEMNDAFRPRTRQPEAFLCGI
jgi:hypothetical protein